MKMKDLFENWGLSSIKLNLKFAELEFNPKPEDEEAAWEMYVELLTRITTQSLSNESGDEQIALNSIYSFFETTRDILKRKGRNCEVFTKIAIIILNQVIRPFTAKWHKISLKNGFENREKCKEFRDELTELQEKLINYSRMLSEIAKVEDLTKLEEVDK